jgi:hypothetical protein
MAKIIKFQSAKLTKAEDRYVNDDNFHAKIAFATVSEELILLFSQNNETRVINMLKELVTNEITSIINIDSKAIHDLNVLSAIERMVGLKPLVFGPTCTDANSLGWIAGFYVSKCMFSSPEMHTEQMARLFNIILFLKLRNMLNSR